MDTILGQDLTGRKFGRLICLKFKERTGADINRYQYWWDCSCECGNTYAARATSLRSGKTTSCGCARREYLIKRNTLTDREIARRNSEAMLAVKKTCSCCNKEKPTSEFHRGTKKRTGRIFYTCECKECLAVRGRKYVSKKRAGIYDRNRRWYYKKYYGMTPEQVKEKKKEAGNRCEICKNEKKIIHIDHCHSTGQIRGLLCFKCNGAIGKFNDDPALLSSAIDYLKKYEQIRLSDPSFQNILRPTE